MPAPRRLPKRERREAILDASLRLFAERGLHGATTRALAAAAGVSEALLYRHFRSKEALFAELQRTCLAGTAQIADRMTHLAPSTSTLVLAIHFMITQILRLRTAAARQDSIKRLMLSSLAGDGDFARGIIRDNVTRYVPKLLECVRAAERAGDLVDRPRHPTLRLYLTHHLAAMLSYLRLPPEPVVDYELDFDTLCQEAVRFALRGVGLREDAIARHYNPAALGQLVERLAEAPPVPARPTSKRPPARAAASPPSQGARR